jgi:hypothetical protein
VPYITRRYLQRKTIPVIDREVLMKTYFKKVRVRLLKLKGAPNYDDEQSLDQSITEDVVNQNFKVKEK